MKGTISALLIGVSLIGVMVGMVAWASWAELSPTTWDRWMNPGSFTAIAGAASMGMGVLISTRDDFPRR